MRRYVLVFRTFAPVFYPRTVAEGQALTLTAREPLDVEGKVYNLPKVNGSAVAGRFRRVLVKNLFRAILQKHRLSRKLTAMLATCWASGSAMDKFLKKLYSEGSPLGTGVDPRTTLTLAQADPVFRLMGYMVLGLSSEVYQPRLRFSILYPAHEEVIPRRFSSFLQEVIRKVDVKRSSAPLQNVSEDGIWFTVPLETREFGIKGEFILSVINECEEETKEIIQEAIKIERESGKDKETTRSIINAVCIAPTSDLVGELAVLDEDEELERATVSVLHHAFSERIPLYGGGTDLEIKAGNYLGTRSSRGWGKIRLDIYDEEGNPFTPLEFERAIEVIAGRVDVERLEEIFGG